jgi:Uma2 family endonuclease
MSFLKDSDMLERGGEELALPPSNLWSDEPPLESDLHLLQIKIFLDCLNLWWRDRNDFYASGNLTIYYNPKKIRFRDFRGPDFFVVLGVDRHPRRSWTVWDEEGRYPNLIVELLAAPTAAIERSLKKQLYQDIFRTPDYFWFDPETLEFQGFHLVDGQYQPLEPNSQGWLWSQQLQLFLGIHEQKLRFYSPAGRLIPTLEEVIEAARQRTGRLAGKLREMGINPDTF